MVPGTQQPPNVLASPRRTRLLQAPAAWAQDPSGLLLGSRGGEGIAAADAQRAALPRSRLLLAARAAGIRSAIRRSQERAAPPAAPAHAAAAGPAHDEHGWRAVHQGGRPWLRLAAGRQLTRFAARAAAEAQTRLRGCTLVGRGQGCAWRRCRPCKLVGAGRRPKGRLLGRLGHAARLAGRVNGPG